MTDKELVIAIIEKLQKQHPRRKIRLDGDFLYIDDTLQFNIDGWSLLYCMHRIGDALRDEEFK